MTVNHSAIEKRELGSGRTHTDTQSAIIYCGRKRGRKKGEGN